MDDSEASRPYTEEEEEKLRRIEEELEQAKAVEFADPEKEEALSAKLDELAARAKSARAGHEKHTPEGSTEGLFTPETGRGLARGLQAAYAIIGVPIVFWGIGWLLDRAVGGVFWQGTLTILGAAAAVFYAVKTVNR